MNSDLISTYKSIRDEWELVLDILRVHHEKHTRDYYYTIRRKEPRDRVELAARLIYLNRTCWNGLYRVNLNGEFNVPVGTKSSVLFEDDDFQEISKRLNRCRFEAADFEKIIDEAGGGDLIFVDPPYTVRHNNNAFVKYNENLFSWFDQERLYRALAKARNRGATVVGTNAYHESIINLYKDNFNLEVVSRVSTISSKNETRKRFEELVISSRDLHD